MISIPHRSQRPISHCSQIHEAVTNREQLLLIPNVADRKRLLLQLLQRNNVTLRSSAVACDLNGST